jgi:ubiquinone/menaquinone biosynthesis C-methylase UbiE
VIHKIETETVEFTHNYGMIPHNNMGKEELFNMPELAYDERDCLARNAEKSEVVSKLVRSIQPKKILDIGVCTGIFYSKYIPEYLEKGAVYGVDIQQEFLDIAARRGIHTAKVNLDKEALPYKNESFDMVICDGILEHTLRPREMFQEISRVLKHSGQLVVIVPSAVSSKRRWRMLRGDSPFFPLIDNLLNKGFMKRCAIFYDERDLRRVMEEHFTIKHIMFLDEKYHDEKAFMVWLMRIWSKFHPSARDAMLAVATNK